MLHIVKNYTGDVLNFQMAAELADDEGIEVASVVVNDDVAVQDSLYTAGRRGVGATVFVEKIAGALAERGAPLAQVAAVAAEVNERSRSFGVALTSCTVPAAGKPTFDLAEQEIELGIGIHGEPGRTRAPLQPASAIVEIVMDAINADMAVDGDLLVMVNGMGGTPLIELYGAFNEVNKYITGHGGRIAQEPGRQLHHQPGDAGLLGDRLPPDGYARRLVGRAGGHTRAPLGTVDPTASSSTARSPYGR